MADNSEFAKSVDNATDQIIQDMKEKMDRSCLVVEGEARKNCPVDQGPLKASITSETETTEEVVLVYK